MPALIYFQLILTKRSKHHRYGIAGLGWRNKKTQGWKVGGGEYWHPAKLQWRPDENENLKSGALKKVDFLLLPCSKTVT
jgi:hypothetical protein